MADFSRYESVAEARLWWTQGGASVYRKARARRERRLFVRIGSSAHRARASNQLFLFSGGTKCATEGGSEPLYRHACGVSVPYVVLRLVLRVSHLPYTLTSCVPRCPGFARVVSERTSSLRVMLRVHIGDGVQVQCDGVRQRRGSDRPM